MTLPRLTPLLLAIAGLGCFGTAHAAFDGPFAPAAWTAGNSNGGNGSFVATADTLSLTSADVTGTDAAFTESVLDYSIVLAAPTTLHFAWSYTTADDNGSSNDTFGYAIDGVPVRLSADASYDAQSGSVTVAVGAGQRFAFQMDALDSFGGSATTTVGDFSATASAVPEPATAALVLAGLGLVGLTARRSRRR